MRRILGIVSIVFVTCFFGGCDQNAGSPDPIQNPAVTTPTYTVVYNGNGNTSGSVPVDGTAYYRDEYATILGNSGALSKNGFTFAGWNSTTDGTGKAYNADNVVRMNADLILYAAWTNAPTWHMKYNGNGSSSGTAPVDSGEYLSGAPITIRGNSGGMILSGKSFAGWNTLPDGSGTSYLPGQNITMQGADIELFAQWKELWATNPTSGSTSFASVAIDKNKNLYVTGHLDQNSSAFGNGVTIPTRNLGDATGRAILAKYNANGLAQWAVTCSSTNDSYFVSNAVDASGNIYAVGYLCGNKEASFIGTDNVAVKVTGYGSSNNLVLVKYDSNGIAQWARSMPSASASCGSRYHAVAVDTAGNVYAAGTLYADPGVVVTLGTGITANGSNFYGTPVLVKYKPDGDVVWAKASTGNSEANFYAIAVDAANNIYASGSIRGTGTFTFGGITVAGSSNSPSGNAVLVKYTDAGNAVWAKSVSGTTEWSQFNALACDGLGNIYAAGNIFGTTPSVFAPGVSAAYSIEYMGMILVKYDSNGTAQWAKSGVSDSTSSLFGIAVDEGNDIFVVGKIPHTNNLDLGNGISMSGKCDNKDSALLIKYDSTGTPLWGRTVDVATGYTGSSSYSSIVADSIGSVFAAGLASAQIGFHDAAPSYYYGGILVKYSGQ